VIAVPREAVDPIEATRTEMAVQFGERGWDKSVLAVAVSEGVLVVRLNRTASSISAVEQFAAVCNALVHLVRTERLPSEIVAVWTLQSDGRPVVGTVAGNYLCLPLHGSS